MKNGVRKSGKGFEIIVNGEVVAWVIGSKKNAEKELAKLIK